MASRWRSRITTAARTPCCLRGRQRGSLVDGDVFRTMIRRNDFLDPLSVLDTKPPGSSSRFSSSNGLRLARHEGRRAGRMGPGGAPDRGGRSARAQGRRGAHPGPRGHGLSDRCARPRRPPIFWRLIVRACAGRDGGRSAWSWPARSKRSAQAVTEFKVGDEVFGGPSSYLRLARRVRLRRASVRRSRSSRPAMTFEEAAAVSDGACRRCRRCDSPTRARAADRRLRRIGIARHGGRAARQALRRPRHRRLQHRRTSSSSDRSAPTTSSTTCRRISPARPDVRRDHRRRRQVFVPARSTGAQSRRGLRRDRRRALPRRDARLRAWRPGSSAAGGSGPRSVGGARRTWCS